LAKIEKKKHWNDQTLKPLRGTKRRTTEELTVLLTTTNRWDAILQKKKLQKPKNKIKNKNLMKKVSLELLYIIHRYNTTVLLQEQFKNLISNTMNPPKKNPKTQNQKNQKAQRRYRSLGCTIIAFSKS